MYAIIETGGKQIRVEAGQKIYVEKLEAEVGSVYTFDKVLLVADKSAKVGAPYVKGVKVEGKVLANGKGKKIVVYKYKAKKNYRRTQGHRQPYTKVEITKVAVAAPKAEAKTEKQVRCLKKPGQKQHIFSSSFARPF